MVICIHSRSIIACEIEGSTVTSLVLLFLIFLGLDQISLGEDNHFSEGLTQSLFHPPRYKPHCNIETLSILHFAQIVQRVRGADSRTTGWIFHLPLMHRCTDAIFSLRWLWCNVMLSNDQRSLCPQAAPRLHYNILRGGVAVSVSTAINLALTCFGSD